MEAFRVQGLVLAALCIVANLSSSPPKRVVSLAPSITEIVYALGAGDTLVAKTRYCTFPEEARRLPDIGGITDPSIEAILAQSPDLVLVSHLTPKPAYGQLKGKGASVLPVTGKGIDGIYGNIRIVADALGKGKEGMELSAKIRHGLENLKRQASGIQEGRRPKALMLLGAGSYFCAGQESFSGEILDLVGAENAAPQGKQRWPQVSMEHILARDPDVIIVSLAHEQQELKAAWQQKKDWQSDPLWQHIGAVKNNRVYFLRDNLLVIPGPRIADAATMLFQHIHGHN